MIITRETASYNQRRYGKPWIAKVDFRQSSKGEFIFGEWTGDHWNGGEGVLTIEATAGDIIAKGQKDNRNPKYSDLDFYVLKNDGSLEKIGDKVQAYKFFLESQKTEVDLFADFSDDEIRAEAKKRGLI